ncbi:UDP-glucoronosyl and UDP-glucosyl transferase domain-containing protein [Ditylenchus destructor]|nr:UDP-glucoronosyl and UDP-glucosyl transferase domain-containing protein [Ditylenchus destructor]
MIGKLISCVILFSCLCAAEKASGRLKILVHMSSIGFSHMQFQGKIADELANAGHEVHILVQEIDPRIANYTVSKNATRVFWNRRPASKVQDAFLIKAAKSPFDGYDGIFIDSGWNFLMEMGAETCEELLANTELFTQLKGEQYDVVIAELHGGCTFGYLHAIGGRVTIATSAVPLTNVGNSFFGIPSFSSYTPSVFAPSISGSNMNFFERFVNFINEQIEYMRLKEQSFTLDQPICNKAYGPTFPSLREIIKNVSLLFVNSNEFLTHSRPISSKIIHIGGILQPTLTDTIKEKHVKEILDNSKNGVILVSFGTAADASKMSMEMRKGFVEAFRQFPTYDFIWKYESSTQNQNDAKLLATAPNVHTVKWVEQRAILAHPKLKVFITHGGMNSINEAAHAGKPMVVIPLFADQLYNAALVKAKGIGEHVEIRSTTNPQFLIDALSKVLNDASYSKNVQVLRRKLELTPFASAERLVKWVEFAAQFPGQLTELNLPNTDELGCFPIFKMRCSIVQVAIITIVLVISLLFTSDVEGTRRKYEGVQRRTYYCKPNGEEPTVLGCSTDANCDDSTKECVSVDTLNSSGAYVASGYKGCCPKQ